MEGIPDGTKWRWVAATQKPLRLGDRFMEVLGNKKTPAE